MKINEIIKTLLFVSLFALVACEAMDDNYKEYLTDKAYSPKVSNLMADSDSAIVTLHWTNPMGTVAERIYITYDTIDVTINEMVDSFMVDGLDVKGYTFTVFTVDKFDNLSVPVDVFVFPDGN